MKKSKYIGILLVVTSICCISIPLIGKAATGRAGHIKSKGIINYDEKVIINSDDFRFLAGEIDSLEQTYKANTVEAVNKIGTYFTAAGLPTVDAAQSAINRENAASLSFGSLRTAIEKSQSVDWVSTVQAVNATGELLTDTAGQPVFYQAASPDNMAVGTAAWVDGHLMLGNGEENQRHYEKGYQDGYQNGYVEVEAKVPEPVIQSGTIKGTDIQKTGNWVVGYLTIPSGLNYFCGGITGARNCRAHSNLDGHELDNGWTQYLVSATVSYDKNTGLAKFVLDLGGECHIGVSPEIDYRIMYIEDADMHIHEPECYGPCTVTRVVEEAYRYQAGSQMTTFYKQPITETHSSCIIKTVDRSQIQTTPITNPAGVGTGTYEHTGTLPSCGK